MEVKYKAGYAKSARSSCHACKGTINMQQLRLGKNTPSTFFDGYQLVWYHPACLVKRDKHLIKATANIESFDHLKWDDQQKVRALLGEAAGEQDADAIAAHKKFWDIRKVVAEQPLPVLKQWLEHNGCPTTGGSSRLIFKCTDGIAHGIPTCPSCKQVGQMNYAKVGAGVYACTALLEWGQCGHVGGEELVPSEPWRFPPSSTVPPALRGVSFPRSKTGASEGPNEEQESVDEVAPQVWGKTVAKKAKAKAVKAKAVKEYEEEEEYEDEDENEDEDEDDEDEDEDGNEDEEEEEEEQGERSSILGYTAPAQALFGAAPTLSLIGAQPNATQPLTGLTFGQAGRLSESKSRIMQLVRSNGGIYTNAITNGVDYVLTTAAEVERGRKKIKKAHTLGLPIVVELLLHRLIANDGTFDPSPYQLQYKGPISAGAFIHKPARLPKVVYKAPKKEKKPMPIKVKKVPKMPKKVFGVKKAPKQPQPKPKVAKAFTPSFGAASFGATTQPFGAASQGFGTASPFGTAPSLFAPKPKPSLFGTTPSLFGAAPSPFGAAPQPFGAPAQPVVPSSVAASPAGSGGSVDPEAKCPPSSRIFVDGVDVYNVMLNQTDITAGVNKFFKLQLIDLDGSASKFVFFAKWGRVGTDIGMNMRKDVTGKKAAIALFADKYKDKAGNEWAARNNFVKKPGKYFPVELEVDTPVSASVPTPAFGVSVPAASLFGPTPAIASSGGAVQGRAKVDVLSGRAGDAHVLEEGGVIYDAMLNQTNIGGNNNKFYVIQVLESNNNSTYWVWNRWGRVGEKGQSALKASSKSGAIAAFKSKFTEKTKNNWDNRDNFKPHDGKYTLMKMEYEEPETPPPDVPSNVRSLLDEPVQDLVNMIFDVRMMNQTLADLNIDVKKMPLGKISKSQILKGYDILTKIDNSLKQAVNRGELTMLSNQFYTLIPHDFGRKIPEIIDNVPLLKLKMKQMETLIEIQVASALLQEAAASGIHPTDAKYKKLGTKIEVLPRYSQDYEMISKYLANTYDPADSPYTLELENVFVINRDGEEERFTSHLERQLLWHGSRLSNWISQGLRIAPPEAPKTGYMFGKGVYFGDMVAKSAEYCFTTPSSNTGLLLLSKVALGKSYELTQPQYMEEAPESFNSCHALAKTMPDPSDSGLMSDMTTKIPFGRGMPSNVPDAFLSHGEYVVYNVAQINMKYLLRVKFNHK